MEFKLSTKLEEGSKTVNAKFQFSSSFKKNFLFQVQFFRSSQKQL